MLFIHSLFTAYLFSDAYLFTKVKANKGELKSGKPMHNFRYSTNNQSASIQSAAQPVPQDIQPTPAAGDPVSESSAKPKKTFTGVRVSKFRHLHGTPMHKSNNIENVRNLSTSLPGDSDAFQVNQEFVAFPLSGPGGQIAVVPVRF